MLDFFSDIKQLRQYYYPLDQANKFPDSVFGHVHTEGGLHNDTHSGDFHVHVEGVIPSIGQTYIAILITAMLVYYIYVLTLLIYHIFRQPKIQNSYS